MELNPITGEVTANGHTYNSEWEYRYLGIMGLCGCGTPEESYNFIREILGACDRRKREPNPNENSQDRVVRLLVSKPEIAAQVMLHLLDTRGVLEHDGTVGRSYLSGEGEAIVDGGEAIPANADKVECPACKGWRDECRLCDGAGEVTEQQARDYGAEP